MSVFRKLHTLFRASVREGAERVTDANAIRIYRQELADAQSLLERRRCGLAGLLATRMDLERDIKTAKRRIVKREHQVSNAETVQCSDELLQLAAQDISATEQHVVVLQERQMEITQRIDREQLTLHKLASEIKEHRREVRLLRAEVARGGCQTMSAYRQTVVGHLNTLQATRDSVRSSVAISDVAEAGMTEAIEALETDSLDRHLSRAGLDEGAIHLQKVLTRLRGLSANNRSDAG